MTGKERIQALLAGEKPDRAPVLASSLAQAVRLRGIAQRRLHTEPEVLADSVIEVSRLSGVDGIYVSSDNWIMHEALGGQVYFPEDDEPWGAGEPLLKDMNHLNHLRVPDPERDGRMPMMLEAARRVAGQAGGEFYIEANIDQGPFGLALTLRGGEQGALDPICQPDRFRELMEFGTQVAIAYGRAMARTGVDAIQFGESSASLVGPEIYRDQILPYDLRVIAAIQESGARAVLHVCGNSTHLLESLACCGADWLELDARVDLDRVFEVIGSRTVIRGNVDTILLLNGPADEIRRAGRTCLEKAARAGGRLILSPGCGVPKFTPIEHVRALVSAATDAPVWAYGY